MPSGDRCAAKPITEGALDARSLSSDPLAVVKRGYSGEVRRDRPGKCPVVVIACASVA